MSYFPNNVDAIRSAPDEIFEPITWEEFYEWRMCNWEMPASVSCILRAEDCKTGKITEHVYQRETSAQTRIMKYMSAGTHDVVIARHDSIHLIKRNKSESTND